MPARLQEALIGWGFKKQNAIGVANVAAGSWRLGKLNTTLHRPKLMTENDAPELGKGHEFPTQVFKSHWDFSGQIDKYLSSDFGAWGMVFGLGAYAKSGTPPNLTYTCTPLDPETDGIELPYFSYIEQMRPGASDVFDYVTIGNVISGWTLNVASGPGRASSKLTCDIVGSGKFTEPSAIAMPAATAEKLLSSASLACTINGVDYVTAKNIVSLEASFQNNLLLDQGFYPGSGTQDGAAIRGRLEVGNRTLGLKFTARFENGSTELTKVTNQTEGTAVLTLTYDANNSRSLGLVRYFREFR